MDNSKIDSNIKQILDLRTNKGVFPLSSENAIIAHSPSGEMTYLDSVLDYLYLQISNKLRLYTEQDGNNARGKAYPATMGLRDSANINSLLNSINTLTALLTSLQLKVNNINPANDIAAINNIINQFQGEFNNLMEASEYTYLEIKFSNSNTLPPSNLEDSRYWKTGPISDPYNLWIGVREVTVKRGNDGRAIITKGVPTIVSLQGPKGDRGPQGPPGKSGNNGRDGDSYRPVFMYKWTTSKTSTPDTPTDPTNLGWAEDPGTPSGDNKYLWMTLNYQNINTNSYLGEWSTPVCLSGEDGTNASLGLMGPVVRFRGEYTIGTEYINASLDATLSSTDIRYIDVVMVTSGLTKTYYMVKPTDNDTRRTLVSPTTSGQLDWEEAAGFSFIAAEALYAQNAHIDNLSGYEFVVQDGNDHIVAGMTGGDVTDSVVHSNYLDNPVRIWAGYDVANELDLTSNNIPFKVLLNGKLKATNAEIKGDLSLDSLSLTGHSYYYNETSITLPLVDSTKHTVIFIITTSKETEVNPHSENVLFALSNNAITTTTSTVSLDKYKIYLAISINDGGTNGWLILNLNSLEIVDNGIILRYYSLDISGNNQSWTVTNQGQATRTFSDGSRPLIELAADLGICNFTTVDTTSYNGVDNKSFSLGGHIYCKYEGNIIATITLDDQTVTTINNQRLASIQSGTIRMRDIITTHMTHNNFTIDIPDSIYIPDIVYEYPFDSIQIQWNDIVNIPSGASITIVPDITLTESFTYVVTNENLSNPVTTTTVSSNGLVIDNGIIVATDMPTGAVVNAKDCIVYKDVTVDPDNEEYEVTNYGTLDVIIGNYTLNPGNSILVKAVTEAHIDFSDITAIDAGDIYDTDPLSPSAPFNG